MSGFGSEFRALEGGTKSGGATEEFSSVPGSRATYDSEFDGNLEQRFDRPKLAAGRCLPKAHRHEERAEAVLLRRVQRAEALSPAGGRVRAADDVEDPSCSTAGARGLWHLPSRKPP